MKRLAKTLLSVLALLLVLVSGTSIVLARRSVIPDNINMSSACMSGMDMSGMDMSGMDMSGMDMGDNSMCAHPAGAPAAGLTPIARLDTPPTSAPVRAFTLTAQMARIDLGDGKPVDAFTYNGTVPGPELRVRQGDLVVVTLVNKLPESTTVHWHGVSVPNAEDGVAGLTQDAVRPGASYTYRFIATEAGTYWYHSHQETERQLPLGMYGALIVEPAAPSAHYDRDYTVFLHEWGAIQPGLISDCHATCTETLSVDARMDRISLAALPGETVRLRIANSGNDVHAPVLLGAAVKVVALDGHDLNAPADLNGTAFPVAPAQRYDLSFVMPARGSVALVDGDERATPAEQHPMVVFGDGPFSAAYPTNPPPFDFTSYGAPAPDAISPSSHFDVQAQMALSVQPGFFNGEFTLRFPINAQTYPSIPAINVNQGDLVRIHISNGGMIPFPHSIHLHGHVFTLLAHNGTPLAGSPVHLDTLLVNPGESYDVAFLADNPGLWMLHCHMVEHDTRGMDMMLNYAGIYTPYSIGSTSGNNPF